MQHKKSPSGQMNQMHLIDALNQAYQKQANKPTSPPRKALEDNIIDLTLDDSDEDNPQGSFELPYEVLGTEYPDRPQTSFHDDPLHENYEARTIITRQAPSGPAVALFNTGIPTPNHTGNFFTKAIRSRRHC